MADGTTSGRGSLFSYALAEGWRNATLRFHRSLVYRPRYAGSTPDRLLIAPTDLRTTDPTIASDIYAGRFIFAGEVVDSDGLSAFQISPPSEEWARELHGFSWLRHLRASDLMVSRSNARSLVVDWIRQGGRHHPIAWEPEVVARRVLSWLSHSPLLLEGCDHAFYRRFMRALTSQIRWLRRIANDGPQGLPRLRIMISLTAAAIALPDQERFLRQAVKWLDTELGRQVLPDGGHISRNPAAVLDILADLLPLRQAFTARGIQPSRILAVVVDRMMPMVRFFRHGDGSFARFNGTGDTQADLIATVLAYDDARGQPLANAPHSGYQRLAAGTTTVIVDTGTPPPIAVSGLAHAGCLSFEMSAGRQRIVINCGAALLGSPRLRRLSRTTAAHSTATINDSSSSRFLTRPGLSRRFGEVITDGPTKVPVRHGQEDGAAVILASHDGYAERFAIIHERRLKLSPTGHRLEGIDTFRATSAARAQAKDLFAVRFHLHPSVKPTILDQAGRVLLTLQDGETWEFECEDVVAKVEESIFFSDIHGNRRTEQIVLTGRPQSTPEIAWSLQRIGLPGRRR